MRVAICGGGALATAICAVAGAEPSLEVALLTRRPAEWSRTITADALGHRLEGRLAAVSDRPDEIVAGRDVVVLALPAFAWQPVLERVAPSLAPHAWVVALPASGGFDEVAAAYAPGIRFAGSRRTPYVARTGAYGRSALIDGVARTVEIAGSAGVEALAIPLQAILSIPVRAVAHFESITLCPANPIMHPARLVTFFGDVPDRQYDASAGFYRDWDDAASRYALAAGDEIAELARARGIEDLPSLREHYGVADAPQLSARLRGLASLRNMPLPLRQITGVGGGAAPDFEHRMFREDFDCGLAAIVRIADRAGHPAPVLREMLAWSRALLAGQDVVPGRTPRQQERRVHRTATG